MRQAEREGRDPLAYGSDPTDHDRERAEDTVQELERFEIYSSSGLPIETTFTLLDDDGVSILGHGSTMSRVAHGVEVAGGGWTNPIELGDGRRGKLTLIFGWWHDSDQPHQ